MNKNRRYGIKISQLLFEIALSIQIFFGLMSFSKIKLNGIFYYIPYCVFIILLIRFIYIRNYNLYELIIITLSIVVLLVTTYLSESLYLISSFSFILLGINVDIDKTIRHMRLWYCLVMLLIIGSVWFGSIENEVKYMYVSATDSYVYRSSVGFSNPNSFSASVVQIAMFILYGSKNEKVSFIRVISAILLALISYSFSGTKTILVICGILVGSYLLEVFFAENKYTRRIFKVLTLSPIICCILSIFGILKFNTKSSVWLFLNALLSNRISYCQAVFKDFGWSIIGQPIVMTERQQINYILDNAYAQLGFKFGVIWLIFFVFLLYRTVKNAYEEKKYNRVIILSAMSFLGITETSLILIYFNFSILFLSEIYWKYIRKYFE